MLRHLGHIALALAVPHACAPASLHDPAPQRQPALTASAQSLPTTASAPSAEAAAGSTTPKPPKPPVLRDADIVWEYGPVMQRLGLVASSMTESEYTYGFSVNERKGIYKFDCSGMAYWVLRKATPQAAAALAWKLEGRPLARDIYRRLASIPAGSPRHGWQRVERVAELRPGDVVAWIKPAIIRSPNTGHVAFVVLPPQAVPDRDNAHLIRIADSSRLHHDDDTRVGRDGFGMGTILLLSDPDTGAPVAYGWVGLKWRTFETEIALGRPVR